MGIRIRRDVRTLVSRLRNLVSDFTPEMREAGDIAADEIVRTTLSGLGDKDLAFAPYSKSYQTLLDAVGGKPSGVVDLRGVFLPQGAREKTPKQVSKNLLKLGGGRKAYIFVTVARGKTFLATTKQTRARKGIIDKASEMSRDLITIEAHKESVKLIYRPRQKSYMIRHQRGDSITPQRKWFSINKSGVRTAVMGALKTLFAARIAEFNSGR